MALVAQPPDELVLLEPPVPPVAPVVVVESHAGTRAVSVMPAAGAKTLPSAASGAQTDSNP
jgi:hypothetical protein